MKQITKEQAAALLMQLKGNQYITLHTRTDARALKTGNPHKMIEKLAKTQVQSGFKYKNSLDNQAKREGVEALPVQERTWGERIENTPLVFYKGKFYLETKPEKVLEDVTYLADGKEVAKESIERFLPKKKKGTSTQANLKKKILVRDYAISSIKKMTHNGETYEIV